jgi:hypothetical protein
VQGVEGPAGEGRPPCAAGERELVLPIVLEVDQRDRVELGVNAAALAQLPSGGRDLVELWLPHQNNLPQLLLVGLRLGLPADLCEHGEGGILGLVDDEDDVAPAVDAFEQDPLHLGDEVILGAGGLDFLKPVRMALSIGVAETRGFRIISERLSRLPAGAERVRLIFLRRHLQSSAAP